MANRKAPPDQRGVSRSAASSKGPLRLRVRSAAESILRSGHPWLFAESIREQNRTAQTGELAVVYDRNDRFLALGLFDAESPIRVRVLHRGKPRRINNAFWTEKLDNALRKRSGLFDAQTTGFRWIHGESDEWPGLVLDRYGTTLVLKLYSPAWLPWLDAVTQIVLDRLHPETIVLRLSRNSRDIAAAMFGRKDGDILAGTAPTAPVHFLETGLLFEADVLRGQKTGFFLDQRENRRKVEELCGGRTVLNAFSFSGGFSVYAARGGARSVSELDISSHALTSASRNFALNKNDPAVNSCVREPIQTDVFAWLSDNPRRRFDLIILDPPSLAKRETERVGALAAYTRLTLLGLAHLNRGGILLACSCSAHVSAEAFFQAVHASTAVSGRKIVELARTGQPLDHPATFPETQYLTAIYLRCAD